MSWETLLEQMYAGLSMTMPVKTAPGILPIHRLTRCVLRHDHRPNGGGVVCGASLHFDHGVHSQSRLLKSPDCAKPNLTAWTAAKYAPGLEQFAPGVHR
jgi:hypothetical protein